MNRIILILSVLILTTIPSYADSPKDYAAWWIKNYGVVDSKIDPLVERAEKVFERVCAASDKKGNRFPRFLIIKAKGDPYAQVITDGTVILTHGGLKICYEGVSPEWGDARVAFILGHELAHLAKDDFWHGLAFVALKEYGEESKVKESLKAQLKWDISDPKTQEFVRKQELQADSYGLVYMTMAGYDPKAIIDKDGTNFFEDWVSQITGKIAYSDSTHPGPAERAEFLRTQLAPVVDVLNFFTFSVRLYQLERYSDAILLFEAFKEQFPSREVFNNIGLCHYQLAMKVLAGCDESLPLRFKLSTIVDTETLARNLRTQGTETASCLKNQIFLKHIQESIRYFKNATEMDPQYLPSRVNLSSALIMEGEYSNALAILDDALKIQPVSPESQNNRAVALYLFGTTSNIDTADHAIGLLRAISNKSPSFNDSLYNMASIQSERGRNAAAVETWKKFIVIEPKGIYAQSAREKIGLKSDGKEKIRSQSEIKSPIKLGDIKGETEKSLEQMKKKEFTIGAFNGEVYEGDNIRILVIDHTVEIVEEEIHRATPFRDFGKDHGEPVKRVRNQRGLTLIYSNFGVDVVDGEMKKVVYFKREGI